MATLDLAQRVALVTGAGTGIGRAIALALGNAGATIGLHYHSSQQGAEETAAILRSHGGRAFLLPADLTNEQEAVRRICGGGSWT